MTITEEQLEVIEDNYNVNRNQERMIMALGKLQEAKDLIDQADGYNTLEELSGTLPVASGEIGEQLHELKKTLGIEPTEFEKATYGHEFTEAPADKAKETITDDFDLFGQLGKFMTDDDFKTAKAKMMNLTYDINAYFADKFDNQY